MEKTRGKVFIGKDNIIQEFLNLLADENDSVTYAQLEIILANYMAMIPPGAPNWFLQAKREISSQVKGIEVSTKEFFVVSLQATPWESINSYPFEMEDNQIVLINYGKKQ